MEPKYEKLKKNIIQMIESGQFKPGDKFYSENELKNKYDVSSITIVKALRELVNEGYIVRYQGKGTYISKRRRNTMVKFTDLEESEQEEICKVRKIATLSASDIFNSELKSKLTEKEDYIHVKREKYNGSTKYVVTESFILSKYINHEQLNNPSSFESIYDRVKEDSNKNLLEFPYKQTDRILFPIFEEVAASFNITEHTPLVFQEKTTYDDDGKVIEYTKSYKLSSYYGVQIEYQPFNMN